jgi:hypothetical protein
VDGEDAMHLGIGGVQTKVRVLKITFMIFGVQVKIIADLQLLLACLFQGVFCKAVQLLFCKI